MKNFIITFGQQHICRINGYTFDKGSVGIIKAENHHDAHIMAMDIFKTTFHQCIPEEVFDRDGSIIWYPRGKHKAN